MQRLWALIIGYYTVDCKVPKYIWKSAQKNITRFRSLNYMQCHSTDLHIKKIKKSMRISIQMNFEKT